MELLIPVKQKLLIEWGVSFNLYSIVYLISKLKSWAIRKEKDGKTYYFITTTKILEELPSNTNRRNIVRNLKKLKDLNIIEKLEEQNMTYYRLSDDKGKKIYAKSDEKKSNEGAEIKDDDTSEHNEFSDFWLLYPKKSAKDEAEAEFKKLSTDEQQKAISAARIYNENSQDTDKKFIILAKNWLKKKLFNDEEYNHQEIQKQTKQNDEISGIVYKIRQVLAKYRSLSLEDKETYLNDDMCEIQLKVGGDLFEPKEKEMLKEVGYTIDNYDDIEFRSGEIEMNFRGYFR